MFSRILRATWPAKRNTRSHHTYINLGTRSQNVVIICTLVHFQPAHVSSLSSAVSATSKLAVRKSVFCRFSVVSYSLFGDEVTRCSCCAVCCAHWHEVWSRWKKRGVSSSFGVSGGTCTIKQWIIYTSLKVRKSLLHRFIEMGTSVFWVELLYLSGVFDIFLTF